jgi:ABC-2 type transport system ATP-binding protein
VIRQVVADLRDDGVTVLLTTHDLDEAERVSDDVVIVDRGRLVAAGTLDDLMRGHHPRGGERIRFTAPAGIDVHALAAGIEPVAGSVRVTETAPGDYEVAAPPTPATVAAITAWLAEHDLPIADLHAGRQRLEDVFLRLTSPGEAGADPTADTDPTEGTR